MNHEELQAQNIKHSNHANADVEGANIFFELLGFPKYSNHFKHA